ncbi:MAG TPA: mechanosensitive ion channel [Bacteroidetes bacterium]|nr:mechanosensitive ion channel [Bacteroidota bacterium]
MENAANYRDVVIQFIKNTGPSVLAAIAVLLIGLWVIKLFVKAVKRAMDRSKLEISLQKFLSSLVKILLQVLLWISVASMLGIATTSFIAILGAAGLAVGLALQGSLANFAGGVLIMIFKPYKVGDVIKAQGFVGKVDTIQIFNTILKTPDNKTIIIPNGPLSGSSITNYSTEAQRRVDMTFGIGYSDDIEKTKEVLKKLVDDDLRILKDPEPAIMFSELGDSSVNFSVRVWCNAADYWGIYFDMQEKVKLAFDKENISIPFPQTDVHLFQNN